MNAAEFTQLLGQRHAPDEPSLHSGGIEWRRVHVMHTSQSPSAYEYWRYHGTDAEGELYWSTLCIQDVIAADLTHLGISLDEALSDRVLRGKKGPLRDTNELYAWLPGDPKTVLELPGGLRFESEWRGARRVVEKYVNNELVESQDQLKYPNP